MIEIPGLKFIEKIGTGGMSTVWKAEDLESGRIVAVKILDESFSGSGEDVRSFIVEEKMMEEIRHEGIVEAYYSDYCNGHWYLVMEYVDGYTFSDFLRRKQHIPEIDCLLIAESVAVALNYAWNDHGIVHCDLKPENIMINSEGIIKVLDLGISHRFRLPEEQAGEKKIPEHVTGTPAYISPEQIYGDVELDCRTDIYSLGATLYHLATGRVLFPEFDNDASMRAHCSETVQARDPRQYRPELSKGFAQLLEIMLVKNRDGRISSWSDVFAMARAVEKGSHFEPRTTGGASSITLDDAP